MKKIIILIFMGCCSFLLSSGVSADTLLLKNGGSFEGIIVEQTDEALKFEVGIGTITVKNKDIAEIIESSDAENKNIQGDWQKQAELEPEQVSQKQEEKPEEQELEVVAEEKQSVKQKIIQNLKPADTNIPVAVQISTLKAEKNSYLLAIPAKHINKNLSLVIGLHWYDGNSMGFMNYWRNEVSQGDITVACPKSIEQGWTAADVPGVIKMIDDIKKSYTIDKIYLVGHSSGGNFALYLGLKYPQKFTAIACVAGSIARARQAIGKVTLYSAASKHIPILVYIGDKDTEQRILNAQNTRRQLKEMGYPVKYKITKNVEHVYMPWYSKEIKEWFGKQK